MPIKVAIILGSVRVGRQTHKIAYYLEKQLTERGFEVIMLDLMYYPLPILEGRMGRDPLPPIVGEVGEKLKLADSMILVTPEYHGSFSGVLKNALDFYWGEFSRKPVGVVAAAGGRMGGINASTQLQHVILSMGAYPFPLKLLVSEIHNAFDDNFNPQNEIVVKNTNKFLDEFSWFSHAIVAAKQENKELI